MQLLYDTFSAFGVISQTPKIMRDPDTGVSRGFGFVSYDSFEASDAAIEAMNGQFLCNRCSLSNPASDPVATGVSLPTQSSDCLRHLSEGQMLKARHHAHLI